jgi:hypothetical protein
MSLTRLKISNQEVKNDPYILISTWVDRNNYSSQKQTYKLKIPNSNYYDHQGHNKNDEFIFKMRKSGVFIIP